MRAPAVEIHTQSVVVSALRHVETARSLAHRPAENHGKSRAQVLESGGRVDKGITSEARNLDGTDDSGREPAHRARSETRVDCGGLKLSSGRASNPGCRGYRPSIPVRER
jgi:hypothetical protein